MTDCMGDVPHDIEIRNNCFCSNGQNVVKLGGTNIVEKDNTTC